MITLRATYQEECYRKGLSLDRYLIAAKCRFGKTYVGSKLTFDGWNSNITLILSGMNVRTEWKKALIQAGYDERYIITTNQELNTLDFNSIDRSKRWVVFVSTQKAGRGNIEERDESALTVSQRLIDLYNSFTGVRTVIFDESHFSEQTVRTQKILGAYHYNKILYLSGTPYTYSIKKSFDSAHTFRFTYKQEIEAFEQGMLDYIPVKLSMYILNKVTCINDMDLSEDWEGLVSDPNKCGSVLSKLISMLKKLGDRNCLLFTNKISVAKTLQGILNKIEGVKCKSAAGNSDRLTSEEATKFFEDNPLTINFIVTCDRLGTGSTIEPLQATIFFCPTRSAIEFIQKSMRCCTEYPGKVKGDVICFNKFGAYSIYAEIVNSETKDKKGTSNNKADFEAMMKVLPLITDEDTELREVSYLEATDFESQYVHGKTKFFEYMENLDSFIGFDFVKAQIADIAKKTGTNKDKLEKAYREGGIDGLKDELKNQGVEDPDCIKEEELDLEKSRALLQQVYTDTIETLNMGNYISIDDERNVTIEYDAESINLITEEGFNNIEFFKSINEEHPEYIRCIKKVNDVQLENL